MRWRTTKFGCWKRADQSPHAAVAAAALDGEFPPALKLPPLPPAQPASISVPVHSQCKPVQPVQSMVHNNSESGLIDAAKVLQLQGRAWHAAMCHTHADTGRRHPGPGWRAAALQAHAQAAQEANSEQAAHVAVCEVLRPAQAGPAERPLPPCRLPPNTSSSCPPCEPGGLGSERQAAFLTFRKQRRRRTAAAVLIQTHYRGMVARREVQARRAAVRVQHSQLRRALRRWQRRASARRRLHQHASTSPAEATLDGVAVLAVDGPGGLAAAHCRLRRLATAWSAWMQSWAG